MKLSLLLLLAVPVAVLCQPGEDGAGQNDPGQGGPGQDGPGDQPGGGAGGGEDQFPCPTADTNADCATCLTENCVLQPGGCLNDCVVADAPCWSMEIHANKSIEEVCTLKETTEADQATCGDKKRQDDCATCTSETISDGSTCQWYYIPGGGYCGAGGCDMMGICGTNVCDAGNVTSPVVEEEEDSPCLGLEACESCLDSKSDCAWIARSCQKSCDVIADAACYHPTNFPDMKGSEICAQASENDEQVFDEGDAMADGGPCNGFDYCVPCLNARIDCAWVGGSCEASCDVIADAACYHPATFNGTGPEICAIAIDAGEAQPVPSDVNETDGTDMDGEQGVDVARDSPQPVQSGAFSIVVQTATALVVSVVAVAML